MNLVVIKGNLTRDPELRYLPNGTAVCGFGLAVNRKWKDQNGEQKEEVSFFDVEAWSGRAETVAAEAGAVGGQGDGQPAQQGEDRHGQLRLLWRLEEGRRRRRAAGAARCPVAARQPGGSAAAGRGGRRTPSGRKRQRAVLRLL